MLVTLEKIEVIDASESLSKMITDSELMENYKECLYKLNADTDAQDLIKEFSKLKESYEEVQRFGKYHPDFHKVSTEMREVKRKLDMHEKISAFKKAEEEIQRLLDEISMLIGHAVSPNIKVPTGNPFFDSLSSCGGGCGSGGSCGCS